MTIEISQSSPTKVRERCPRCSHPNDLWETTCGYCHWPYNDKGVICMQCNNLNRAKAISCKLCGHRL